MDFLTLFLPHLPYVATIVAIVDLIIILFTIPWVLSIKKESTAAVAWCLIVILLPLFGFLLFVTFGYTYVYRRLKKKRRHRARFRARRAAGEAALPPGKAIEYNPQATYYRLGWIAMKLGAFPVTGGNEVTLYHETEKAFAHLLDAIKDARHHVHVEFFIIRPDETGNQFLDLLVEKARQGVQVRLLYDSLGSWGLARRFLHKLQEAGGKYSSFLPLAPLRRKFQVNMRNHRKIVVVDGRIAFTGGMNIANEYLGKNPRFGYWRDGFLRLEGPATADFQRIFVEDWDFAAAESIEGKDFFPPPAPVGDEVVQVIQSGPDQEVNSMRELIFAAITTARERLWISTPYVVPDTGIFDALRMAARAGVDVRILWLLRPDHYLPFFAARYYMPDLLDVGVKVYQYAKGMMHAKMMMVDGKWGWMGSTNLDYRSLRLNFEANCIFHTPALVAEMERAFQNDLKNAICMDGKAYAGRPFVGRMIENGCRLLSPML